LAKKKNRKRIARPAAIAIALASLLTASNAAAGGPFEPQPPDYMIEIVPGVPLSFDLEGKLPAETDSVRFDIDGKPFMTDYFAPYGDEISTRFIDRRGVSFDTVHDFNILAMPFFPEDPVTVAEYHLLVHQMPVIPRFRTLPLVRENRRKLVGFQLRGVSGRSKVRMWGRGFERLRGREQLPLRLVRAGEGGRTYAVRGGLTWRRGAAPHVVISVHPGFQMKHGAFVLGRVYTGVLRTQRDGDTNIRRIGPPDWCTDEISRRDRPPPRQSCDHF
jgi:hypothetical protein